MAALVAGCGSSSTSEPVTTAPPTAPARPTRTSTRPAEPARRRVVVTVVDGDTGHRVPGARVRIGTLSDRANPKGNAELLLRRLAPLVVSVRARGYDDSEQRMPFQHQRRVVVRLYRERLQWPMYGATFARTQAHPAIRARPPFASSGREGSVR